MQELNALHAKEKKAEQKQRKQFAGVRYALTPATLENSAERDRCGWTMAHGASKNTCQTAQLDRPSR